MSPHNSPPNLIDIVSQTLNKACKGQAGIRVNEQLSSHTSSSTLYPCRSIDRVLSVATGFASLLEKAKCVKLIQYAKSNSTRTKWQKNVGISYSFLLVSLILHDFNNLS